jgi:hypothetical protein
MGVNLDFCIVIAISDPLPTRCMNRCLPDWKEPSHGSQCQVPVLQFTPKPLPDVSANPSGRKALLGPRGICAGVQPSMFGCAVFENEAEAGVRMVALQQTKRKKSSDQECRGTSSTRSLRVTLEPEHRHF